MKKQRQRTLNPQIVAAIITGIATIFAALIIIFPQLRPWSEPISKKERTAQSEFEPIPRQERVAPSLQQTTLPDFTLKADLVRALKQGHSTTYKNSYTVNSICFSPDGETIASGTEGSVELWNVQTGKLKRMMVATRVSTVIYSHDSERLIATVAGKPGKRRWLEGEAVIWYTRTWEIKQTLTGTPHELNSLALSPNGKLIAGSGGAIWQTRPKHRLELPSYIIVWDTQDEMVLWKREFSNYELSSVAFSPDGKFLVSGDTEEVKVWLPQTGEQITRLKRTRVPGLEVKDLVECVSFSRDGKTLASGNRDGTVILWDTKSWRQKQTLRKHKSGYSVKSLAFSPDGKILATGSLDKTVNLWHTERGKLLAVIEHRGMVNTVAFSPDTRILASAGYDRKIKLWSLTKP